MYDIKTIFVAVELESGEVRQVIASEEQKKLFIRMLADETGQVRVHSKPESFTIEGAIYLKDEQAK